MRYNFCLNGKFAKLVALFFLTTANFLCFAGVGKWTNTGPYGGTAYALAVDFANESTLYASTLCGIYKTTDGGENWSQTAESFSSSIVTSLAVDPLYPETIYAGTQSDGLFKSLNGGINWENCGFHGYRINCISIDPKNSSNIFVVAVNQENEKSGLFKSEDSGLSWKDVSPQISDDEEIHVARIDPQDTSIIYLGTSAALYKSIDGGENWFLPCSSFNESVEDIQINPQSPNVMFLLSWSIGTYLYKSDNGGQSWQIVDWRNSQPNSDLIKAIKVDPRNGKIIYVVSCYNGIFKSSDEGKNFIQLPDNSYKGSVFEIDPFFSSLYIAGCCGINKSSDGGYTWFDVNKGIYCADIAYVTTNKYDKKTLYAGRIAVDESFCANGYGLLAREDINSQWKKIGLERYVVRKVITHPSMPQKIYVVANNLQAGGGAQLFRSCDGGLTWNSILDFIAGFAIDPNNPQVQYASTGVLWPPNSCNFYKSKDGGDNWEKLVFPEDINIYNIAVNPNNSSEIFIFTDSGMYKSEDGGSSWQEYDISGNKYGDEIIFSENNPLWAYAVMKTADESHSLFRSSDGGKSWTKCDLSGKFILISLDPTNYRNIYSIVWTDALNSNLMKSDDAGLTFKEFYYGKPSEKIMMVEVDRQDPSILYAAAMEGVFEIKQTIYVTQIVKQAEPFRLKVEGDYFVGGTKVFIGEDAKPWDKVIIKSQNEMIIKGGKELKSKLPKGKNIKFRFVNPDGGEAEFFFKR